MLRERCNYQTESRCSDPGNQRHPNVRGVPRELGAYCDLSPREHTPSEPQRECGQANWGSLFYFIRFLLGLVFIEKPSGLWTINHLSQRLILALLFLPPHPRHSPKTHPESSATVKFILWCFCPCLTNREHYSRNLRLLEWHYFLFQICEWGLKYKSLSTGLPNGAFYRDSNTYTIIRGPPDVFSFSK